MIVFSYVHQVIERRSTFDGELGFTARLSFVDLIVLRVVTITDAQRVAGIAFFPTYPSRTNKQQHIFPDIGDINQLIS